MKFIKLYLAMEQWFHQNNPKQQVMNARRKIGNVPKLMKQVFPRTNGHGCNIPKYHGMSKMQYYMRLFGSAMNFFGGPGESHHKTFAKYLGGNTQRRVCEFAKQVANRIYETMIIACVRNKMREEDNFEINDTIETNSMNGDINCVWSGKYLLTVESLEVGNCKYLVKSYVKYLIMKTCRGISRCVM